MMIQGIFNFFVSHNKSFVALLAQGWLTIKGTVTEASFIEMRLVDEEPDSTSLIMNLEGTTERLALQTEVLINLTDVKQAVVSEDNHQAGYRVNLVFTSEGALSDFGI